MKISRLVALAAFAILLTGCQSVGERRAVDEGRCSSYGFRPGSNAYANCLQRIDLQRADNVNSLRYNTWVALGHDDWRRRDRYPRRDMHHPSRPHSHKYRPPGATPVCKLKSCR